MARHLTAEDLEPALVGGFASVSRRVAASGRPRAPARWAVRRWIAAPFDSWASTSSIPAIRSSPPPPSARQVLPIRL